jgi:hypothetical protein
MAAPGQRADKKDIYCLSLANRQNAVKLYVGTDPAHLFESDDLGENWTEITSLRDVPSVSKWFFPAPPKFGHVKNVAVNSSDPNVVYACIEQEGFSKLRTQVGLGRNYMVLTTTCTES